MRGLPVIALGGRGFAGPFLLPAQAVRTDIQE
jgi:hypothetical protein